MTDRLTITLEFQAETDLAREYEASLKGGSVVARDVSGLEDGDQCQVVLVHPQTGQRYTIPAVVVWTTDGGPPCDVGLAFVGFDELHKDTLRQFINHDMPARVIAVPDVIIDAASLVPDTAPFGVIVDDAPVGLPHTSAPPPVTVAGQEPKAAQTEEPHTAAAQEDEALPATEVPESLHDRVRHLSLAEQIRLAREGTVSERVLLERLYGKMVWESLLTNPRLTIPEVARIARMGSLSLPLLESIISNTGWLRGAPVRRSLLANPRLTSTQIEKVLAMLPKSELKLVPTQTAYPSRVRDTARRMLKALS